jgi:hypothetical protein
MRHGSNTANGVSQKAAKDIYDTAMGMSMKNKINRGHWNNHYVIALRDVGTQGLTLLLLYALTVSMKADQRSVILNPSPRIRSLVH